MKRIAAVVAAVLAVILLVIGIVFIIRKNRARKAEEEAARLAATDVMDMPFSVAAPADEAENATSAETGSFADAGGAGSTESGAGSVHVNGVDAIALYVYDEASGMRIRTEEYASAWTRGEDIVSLEAFAADTQNIILSTGGSNAWYSTWRAYWQQEESTNCRIGYQVSFALANGEQIDATLLKPGDELSYRTYLENYLYDDAANADAGWYSHLEPDDLTEETLMTSIKFTPGEQIDEIAGNITVTAFVYDSVEDFDYDGNYIGDCSFTTVLVKR